MHANYRRVCERAEIEHPLKAYALRHTFMTHGLDDGVPIDLLAEIAGHADCGALARKTHIAPRTARQKVAVEAVGRRLRALAGTAG